MAWLVSLSAYAADWVVDPSGAGDFTTIQDAIDSAADGDFIDVVAATYSETIDFSGKDVEVRGAGIGSTILDGAGTATNAVVFSTSETSSAILADLTIRNGTERAIYIHDASPNIEGVEFDTLGRTTSALFNGGGALVEGGSPLFDGCTWVDNGASRGADLYITNAASVTVREGSSSGGLTDAGGVIFVDDGTLDISDHTLEPADAGLLQSEGLSYVIGSASTLDATRITVDGGFSEGAAVLLEAGATLNDTDGLYVDNRQGFWADGGGDITLDGTVLRNNGKTASSYSYRTTGARVLWMTSGTFTATDVLFDKNMSPSEWASDYRVGAVYTQSGVTSVETRSHYVGCPTCQAGGRRALGTVTMEDPVFEGFDNDIGLSVDAPGGEISGLTFTMDGHAEIPFEMRSGTVRGCVISALNPGTAAMVNVAGGTPTFEDCRFSSNDRGSGAGGAIYQDGGNLTIRRSSFVGNSASSGGGIYVYGGHAFDATLGTVLVEHSTFDDNHGAGAALYVDGNGHTASSWEITLRNNRFVHNGNDTTPGNGGAVYIVDVNGSEVVGNVFCDNIGADGGAAYSRAASGVATWTNNVFHDNAATNEGGAVYAQTALVFVNNTLVDNFSVNDGVGMLLSGSSIDLVNNTFSDHANGEVLFDDPGGTIEYNNFYDNNDDVGGTLTTTAAYGTGTVYVDPDFVAWSSNGDCSDDSFGLASTSSLIDAGDPAISDPDGSDSDIGYSGGPDSPFVDNDADGWDATVDCDDTDADINPGATETWYDGVDTDCDGADDYDQDADGFRRADDCDDADADAYPGAVEVWYDGADQDCDGGSDYDQDGDGFDHDSFGGSDCNDVDAAINTTATETWYDGVDSDCDGGSDYDQDGDGDDADTYGGGDCDDTDASFSSLVTENWYDGVDSNCDGASDYDQDGDGFDHDAYGGSDCDDVEPSTHPEATDTWYDGVDSNCDGASDYDQDGDGFDHDSFGGSDCDDDEPSTYPGAADTWYDGVDSNCDLASDYDQDGDGYDHDGYGGGDCDDVEPSTYPGAADAWYDGVDSNCDLASDYDQDGDGHDTDAHGGLDCNDLVVAIRPGVPEVWYDGVDQDCDGSNDYDQDGDGSTSSAHGGTDCNDVDDTIHPAAMEQWYDGLDQNCDGADDYDQDGDGFRSASFGGFDCNDAAAAVHPGAKDPWYDGVDSDCDGADDYDQDRDGYRAVVHGGDDCDDLQPKIFPGAPDEWYDGVDSDCNGASDFDQDADGADSAVYGGTDCDDADADIHPSATEVWYDGVDSDCDGASDFDQDADGFDASEHGGSDCYDTDAQIRPGAEERWYDGIDQNCDGRDDYDRDGDGVTQDTDCNDDDASVFPGAPDATYDGVDSDCAGGSDYDADGDGFDSAAYGGLDCDDRDPAAYPGSDDVDCDRGCSTAGSTRPPTLMWAALVGLLVGRRRRTISGP